MKLNQKKGVSGVVTAVLLILLVIAAIAILWVVVQNFVKEGGREIPGSADCLSTGLDITNIVTGASGTVTIKRTGGSASITDLQVYVVGNNIATGLADGAGIVIGQSFTTSPGVPISTGNIIEVVPIVNGKTCGVAVSRTA